MSKGLEILQVGVLALSNSTAIIFHNLYFLNTRFLFFRRISLSLSNDQLGTVVLLGDRDSALSLMLLISYSLQLLLGASSCCCLRLLLLSQGVDPGLAAGAGRVLVNLEEVLVHLVARVAILQGGVCLL